MILQYLSRSLLSRNQLASKNLPKWKSITTDSITIGQLQRSKHLSLEWLNEPNGRETFGHLFGKEYSIMDQVKFVKVKHSPGPFLFIFLRIFIHDKNTATIYTL